MKFKLGDKVWCLRPQGTRLKVSPVEYTISSILDNGTLRLLEDGDIISYDKLLFRKIR
jgi:hypothetical protein